MHDSPAQAKKNKRRGGNELPDNVVTADKPFPVQVEVPMDAPRVSAPHPANTLDRLRAALASNTGYMRVAPEDKGGVHLIWQWTLGLYAKRYVYWFVAAGQSLNEGIDGLLDKVDLVECGQKRPAHVRLK